MLVLIIRNKYCSENRWVYLFLVVFLEDPKGSQEPRLVIFCSGFQVSS